MKKSTWIFILIAFGLSWLLAAIFFLAGGKYNSPGGLIIATAYMFCPLIAALVVQKFYLKEKIATPLGMKFNFNFWWAIGWLGIPVIMFIVLGFSLFHPGIRFSVSMEGMIDRFSDAMDPQKLELMKAQVINSPGLVILQSLVSAIIAGATINAIAGFGEEAGWRGFLQKELIEFGFWPSSLLIGVIWGFWHAPLILAGHNFPDHPVAGVFMMTVAGTLLGPLVSYIRLRAKSVFAASVMHGTINASYGFTIMFTVGGNDLTTGLFGLPGLFTMLVLNLIIFVGDKEIRQLKEINDQ